MSHLKGEFKKKKEDMQLYYSCINKKLISDPSDL